MEIKFEATIESNEYSTDMKSGLDTLQGISDSARTITEGLLIEEAKQKRMHNSSVRTKMRNTFEGSYGIRFSVEILSEDAKRKIKKMGTDTYKELLSYFINEALYIETKKLSEKAQAVINELGEKEERILEQLRKTPLTKAHESTKKFGKTVEVKYTKRGLEKQVIAKFNKESAAVVTAKKANEIVKIEAAITRLNINTGNGRLSLKNEENTVAFGFTGQYKNVKIDIKEKISANLDKNNLLESENREHLKIKADTIKTGGGKIIKYLVTEIENG